MNPLLFRKIFIGIMFAALLIGELSFQIYTNGERTLVNLANEEQSKLDSVLTRKDVEEEKGRAIKRAAPFEEAKKQYVDLNAKAAQRNELYHPYDEMIFKADQRIDEAWKPYYALVNKLQSPIRAEYKKRRDNADSFLGSLSGIQYGVSATLLAVGLAFFATLLPNANAWKWILFVSSFVAQFVACTMIWHGAMLKFNDELQAWAFGVMFFMCAPLAFHWGTILFKKEVIEDKYTPKALVTERTESIEFSKKHTISETQKEIQIKPSNPDEAIDLYAQKKISADNGWSQRRIAKEYFGGKLTEVNNRIKRREIELAKFEIV